MKRGWGSRPLLKSEIEAAQSISHSACEAARKLHVCLNTFKKYAKQYGIYKTNIPGKGMKKVSNPHKGKYPLSRLLSEYCPSIPIWRFKQKLIDGGIKEDKCEICGESEKRTTDNKTAIVVCFRDGNKTNTTLANIEFCCFNCTFKYYGSITGKKSRLVTQLKAKGLSRIANPKASPVESPISDVKPAETSPNIPKTEVKNEPDLSKIEDVKVDPNNVDLTKL